jgi:hypothetical protein
MFCVVPPSASVDDIGRIIHYPAPQNVMDSEIVFLPVFSIANSIVVGERVFDLAEPVIVHVTQEEGAWIYESPRLSVISYGTTKREAEAAFRQDFVALYDHIAVERDEFLTQSAIVVKNEFLRVVQSVRRA